MRVTASLLAIVLIGLVTRMSYLPEPGFLRDQEQFFNWAHIARTEALGSVYEQFEFRGRVHRWCNYPPLHVVSFSLVSMLAPAVTGEAYDVQLVRDMSHGVDRPAVRAGYALFKMPAVLADMATAILIYWLLRRRVSEVVARLVALLYVVQPVVVHNAAIWGQVDAVHTLWMVLSLEAVTRRRPYLMGAWALLALLTKPQAIILAPVWAAVLVVGFGPITWQGVLRRVGGCAAMAAVVFAVVAEIFQDNSPGSGLWDAYFKAVGFYPNLHLNGFSLWFLVNPLATPDPSFAAYGRDDLASILGLTPRHLGLVAFALVATMVFIRLWQRRADAETLRWAARVLPLAFFVLPTQIHERYLFPAVALWAWGFQPRLSWWVGWVVIGLAAAANAVWVFPGSIADSVWTGAAEMLRSSWAGLPSGVWCAIALILVLLMALARGFTPRAAFQGEAAPVSSEGGDGSTSVQGRHSPPRS